MALVALCGGVHPRRLAWQVQEPMRRLRQLAASALAERTRAGSGRRWTAATRRKLPSHTEEPSPSTGGLSGIPCGGELPGREGVRRCPPAPAERGYAVAPRSSRSAAARGCSGDPQESATAPTMQGGSAGTGVRHQLLGKLLEREERRRCAVEGGDSIRTLELGRFG